MCKHLLMCRNNIQLLNSLNKDYLFIFNSMAYFNDSEILYEQCVPLDSYGGSCKDIK
jgi:hypothetical protein